MTESLMIKNSTHIKKISNLGEFIFIVPVLHNIVRRKHIKEGGKGQRWGSRAEKINLFKWLNDKKRNIATIESSLHQ